MPQSDEAKLAIFSCSECGAMHLVVVGVGGGGGDGGCCCWCWW